MTPFLTGFHPTFDALSACADLSDTDAARTRVGRHAARCAVCRATVAEIRAMGDSARGIELPGAPAGLWAAIEAAGDKVTTVAQTDAPREVPMLRPTVHVAPPARQSYRRVGIIVGALAATLVALLLLPSPFHRTLDASPGTGTWRFSPANPRPGATVRVRFTPPASFPADPRLLLLGQFTRPAGARQGAGYFWAVLDDSLAMLDRALDGTYEGTMRMPSHVAAAVMHVAPPAGPYARRLWDPQRSPHLFERPVALLVGGDSTGRPALVAMEAALSLDGSRPTGAGYPYRLADTLIRYFPSHPLGYAVDERVGGRRLLDDVIAWFKRGERQYVKFEERLMAQPVVDADRELAMVRFANRIAEPGEQRRWVMRLVREHPEDPRTLMVYSQMLYEMLNREYTVDSVRRGLPLADSLYLRNGGHDWGGEIASIAGTVHDTGTSARWSMRGWRDLADVEHPYYRGWPADGLLHDASRRSAALPYLRASIDQSCELPAGRYPSLVTVEEWKAMCVTTRRDAYASMSRLYLEDGQPRRALVYADSALALPSRYGCQAQRTRRRRGDALLALGDTTAAIRELALGTASMNWQGQMEVAEIGRQLRPSVDSATWKAATDSAHAVLMACVAEAEKRKGR